MDDATSSLFDLPRLPGRVVCPQLGCSAACLATALAALALPLMALLLMPGFR